MYKCKFSKRINGEITVPGDKSITHRGIMLGSLAEGKTELKGFLNGADCMSTLSCFEKMGIEHKISGDIITVEGKGLHGLSSPSITLDTGNSGTTTRLISGILSGQSFSSRLSGDASLNSRPMKRVIEPLSLMGANIVSENGNGCAPLLINPADLKPIHYNSPVASAQVKSAILLAGLYAEGETSVTEPVLSRDHTERMVNGFGGKVVSDNNTATITGLTKLYGQSITIPGDISSAAYFIAAGLLADNWELLINNVNINKTRAGILEVVRMMGGNVSFENKRTVSGEEVSDLLISPSSLKGVTVGKDLMPSLIDEIPVIAVMAAFAEGETVIKDASELRVKESDRIKTITKNLLTLGADIMETEDGMIIRGGKELHGGTIESFDDHRIAMAFSVAGLNIKETVEIDRPDCVNISYPDFYKTLEGLIR